jgi:hypothetical protein
MEQAIRQRERETIVYTHVSVDMIEFHGSLC